MKLRAWVAGGLLVAWLAVPLLIVGGCSKPVFSIAERKVCKNVDGSGNPTDETTTFTPEDARAYVWFRYVNATPGQIVKVKFTYTDELGNEATEEQETELKVGDGTAAASLAGEEGGPLAPGRYTAELLNQTDVAYGPALAFTVGTQASAKPE